MANFEENLASVFGADLSLQNHIKRSDKNEISGEMDRGYILKRGKWSI